MAMGLCELNMGRGNTPVTVQDAFLQVPGGFTPVKSVKGYSNNDVPEFDGLDLNWSAMSEAYPQVTVSGRLTSFSSLSNAIMNGSVALLNVPSKSGRIGGHWVLARGADTASQMLDIRDPGSSVNDGLKSFSELNVASAFTMTLTKVALGL